MAIEKGFLRHIAIIGISFIIGGFILAWFRYDIGVQADKFQSLRSQLNQEANLTVSFASLKDQAAQASAYEERFQALLPVSDKLINFKKFLEVLGDQRGVKTTFAFEGSRVEGKGGGLSSIGFSIGVTGSLEGIKGLLNDIEVNPQSYLLKIETFTMSEQGTGLQAVFKGRLFYREAPDA